MYLDPLAFTELACVLLPFDASRASFRALEHLIAANKDADFHVHVLNIQEPTLDDRVFLRASLHEGHEIVRWACDRLEAAGIKHSSEVAVGVPSETILTVAKRESHSEIVMGTRGAIARYFSGSVSGDVARLAEIPVTRVR
jgi:nucleotide-binding universal stress UspA family protein